MHGALAGEANIEVADVDEPGHASFGTLSWKSVARWNAAPIAQQRGLVEGAADQLHADRQDRRG